MKEFLFYKNLWVLDCVTSVIFAFCLGYYINLVSDNSEKYEQIDLICGVLAYLITIILALNLHKNFYWLPSWAWLGIFGALFRALFLQLLFLPINLDYLQYSASVWDKIYKMISDLFIGTVFNWIFWGIAGLLCIFTIRIFAYLFQTISGTTNRNE